MFVIERRETAVKGGKPVHLWTPIYKCPEKWPLELLRQHLSKTKYRIIDMGRTAQSGPDPKQNRR